jgi:hypothetical protein
MPIIGWNVAPLDVDRLRLLFPPKYVPVPSPHCTLSLGLDQSSGLPGPTICEIYGKVDDFQGVEALLVSLNGNTVRPDGKIFHITWSLAKGRKARESNDVIKLSRPKHLDARVEVNLIPAVILPIGARAMKE